MRKQSEHSDGQYWPIKLGGPAGHLMRLNKLYARFSYHLLFSKLTEQTA